MCMCLYLYVYVYNSQQHAGVKKWTFQEKLGLDNKTSLDQSVRLQGPHPIKIYSCTLLQYPGAGIAWQTTCLPMSHIFTLLDYQYPNINTKGEKFQYSKKWWPQSYQVEYGMRTNVQPYRDIAITKELQIEYSREVYHFVWWLATIWIDRLLQVRSFHSSTTPS